MSPRISVPGSLALALLACGKPTEVELRLYPCEAVAPWASVRVQIQGYDGDGAKTGPALDKTFEISDPAVFADGYATIGFLPPDGVVSADFTLTWAAGAQTTSALYAMLGVPRAGEALVLGEDDCVPDGATSTGEPGSTTVVDPSTSTGAGTTTTTGETSSGTTDGTTTTGSSTEAETTTTGETTEVATETTDGTTGGPVEGGMCDMQGIPACDGAPGVVGTLLQCDRGTWVQADLGNIEGFCAIADVCPPGLGLVAPKISGCVGDADVWTCICSDGEPMGCGGEPSGCGPEIPNYGTQLQLCTLDAMNNEVRHRAVCGNGCALAGDDPVCLP